MDASHPNSLSPFLQLLDNFNSTRHDDSVIGLSCTGSSLPSRVFEINCPLGHSTLLGRSMSCMPKQEPTATVHPQPYLWTRAALAPIRLSCRQSPHVPVTIFQLQSTSECMHLLFGPGHCCRHSTRHQGWLLFRIAWNLGSSWGNNGFGWPICHDTGAWYFSSTPARSTNCMSGHWGYYQSDHTRIHHQPGWRISSLRYSMFTVMREQSKLVIFDRF
ncbi:hypothetical protein B0O80DRAFT_142871 [Mortierella sp. GBAus27b]|nr:hypothetical protein B0O80DRAFT_142871 [Mortierella sp. GBAus27b]